MNKQIAFLGDLTSFEKADIVIIPCPYEGAISYGGGTKEGPQLILDATDQIEFFDYELGKDISKEVKMHTMNPLQLDELKDEALVDRIYQAAKLVFRKDKFPIVLGGDHSVSIGAIEAASEKHENLTIVHIDAHADLRDEYNDSKFSHACVMRRAFEFRTKIVQVGVRSLSKQEDTFIKQNDIKTFFAPFKTSMIPEIVSACTDKVYLTIDVDGFDPSVIPATGTPVPGGLLWYDALELFKELFAKKTIVGMDLVELSKGPSTVSQDTAAALIYKLIGYR